MFVVGDNFFSVNLLAQIFRRCTMLHTLKIDTPIQTRGFIQAAVSLPSLERLLLDVVTADDRDVACVLRDVVYRAF